MGYSRSSPAAPESDANRLDRAFIRAIKRDQGLGFTLEEIGHLLHTDGSGQDLLIAATAVEKLQEVDAKTD